LDDEVGAPERVLGVVEQPAHDRRGGREWHACDHPVRLSGQAPVEEVGVDNPEASSALLQREVFEACRPDRIGLHGDDPGAAPYQLATQRARSGADIDDQLTRGYLNARGEALSCLCYQEVLPETASSFVSGCPPAGGHGA
jgi:hypothetical protein